MNHTRGFVNLNRFKLGKAIKRLSKAVYQKGKKGNTFSENRGGSVK